LARILFKTAHVLIILKSVLIRIAYKATVRIEPKPVGPKPVSRCQRLEPNTGATDTAALALGPLGVKRLYAFCRTGRATDLAIDIISALVPSLGRLSPIIEF
jgi:hypothetical protein